MEGYSAENQNALAAWEPRGPHLGHPDTEHPERDCGRKQEDALIGGRELIVNRNESAEREGAEVTRHMAQTAARAAAGMFGRDTTIIDLRGFISYTDYFVVTGARTERQARRIAEEVLEKMRGEGYRPTGRRHDEGSGWISLDFLDLVVHVLTDEAREYYRLESLWRAAPQEQTEEHQLAQQMMQQQHQA